MYTNLLNMGEPVNVQPLPQPLLTSPFNYADTGLLPISIPTYATPTPQPYTPIQPGPFGVQPVAPVAPVRRDLDSNPSSMEDLGITVEPTVDNALGILGNLASFVTGPFGFLLGSFGNMAANRNTVSIPNPLSLLVDLFSGNYGGFDGKGGYGTGGVDPDAYADAVTTAAFDAFGAAFEGPGTASWAEAVDGLADGIGANEAPGGIDYSGEVGGYNDPGGFDFGDMSDFGGGDAGDGGDGGTYICTAAFKAGISPKERFRQNRKYGIKMRREDPVLMRGYDIVGPWIAKKIGHTGAGEFLTKIYAKQTTGEKMTLKERILFAILSNTIRPALRVVGALC